MASDVIMQVGKCAPLVTYSDGQHGGAGINGEGTRKSESAGCVCMLDRR